MVTSQLVGGVCKYMYLGRQIKYVEISAALKSNPWGVL